MLEHARINLILEIVNGSILVLLCAVALHLAIYICQQKDKHGLPWRIALFDPPLGVLLAMPMLTIKIGAIMSLGAVWAFRLFMGGHRMPVVLVALLLAGIVILLIGALWLIRVLTCSRWGERAWAGSAALMVLYVVVSLVGHHLLDGPD